MTRVSLGSLVPDPSNARLHGPENLEAIAASLKRFGQTEPLIVQKATRRIIGGNGRHRAMQQLGWTECNIVEVDCDNLEATSLAIALNRTAELATWDNETLSKLLSTLRAEDALDGVGFDTNQIDDLLAELKANEPHEVNDPGPGAPPEVAVSRRGDLWILGDHRLLCGDSTHAADVERLLSGARPVLFSCDPPYCVKYDGNNRPIHNGKSSGKDWSAVYHEVDIEDLGTFLSSVFEAYIPRIEESAPFYIWHAHLQQPNIARVFEKHNILFHQVIVWCKPTPVFTHCYYQWQHEVCAFGWIKGNKPQHGIAQHSTVWHVDWEGKQRIVNNEHPTQKPIKLFSLPMELHTRPGDVVVEAFSGSGSQLIAAETTGRKCYAMEIEPVFIDVAIERWQLATGKVAILESTKQTFEQVAAERKAS